MLSMLSNSIQKNTLVVSIGDKSLIIKECLFTRNLTNTYWSEFKEQSKHFSFIINEEELLIEDSIINKLEKGFAFTSELEEFNKLKNFINSSLEPYNNILIILDGYKMKYLKLAELITALAKPLNKLSIIIPIISWDYWNKENNRNLQIQYKDLIGLSASVIPMFEDKIYDEMKLIQSDISPEYEVDLNIADKLEHLIKYVLNFNSFSGKDEVSSMCTQNSFGSLCNIDIFIDTYYSTCVSHSIKEMFWHTDLLSAKKLNISMVFKNEVSSEVINKIIKEIQGLCAKDVDILFTAIDCNEIDSYYKILIWVTDFNTKASINR